MHPSQYEHTRRVIHAYLPSERHVDVLDLGSATSPNQTTTHKSLLAGYDHSYVGVDVREGNNVDVVMRKPYSIPAPSCSKDAVISGSVFEHIPFFWASMLEVARVLRPGGLFFFTAPSRGHKHTVVDCWRYYPDGIRAMAAATHMRLLEVHTHFPPLNDKQRHDYARIDTVNHYWGDTVAVFEKPDHYPLRMRLIRPVVRGWANWSSQHGPLGRTPKPRTDCKLLEKNRPVSLQPGSKGPASPGAQPKSTPPAKSTKPAAPANTKFPKDFDEEAVEIIKAVQPYTMTGIDKLHALISTVRYIARHNIPGDIVECGVWRGGSMQAVARTLDRAGIHDRELYLYDTYEGMTPPTENDVQYDGRTASERLAESKKGTWIWADASLEDVKHGFTNVPYPVERLHFIKGPVEQTIPKHLPERIAILRLDTDWYESTAHELKYMYDRLVPGGVLMLDDYGYWQGARKATDEFLERTGEPLLLLRMGSGRVAVKR